MFDSVLDRGAVPEQRFGAGVAFSAVVIGLMGAIVVYASTRPMTQTKKEREVTFFAGAAPPPPPPPPPPLGGGQVKPKTEQKPQVIKKPDTIYDTKDQVKPKEQEKPKEQDKPAEAGGVEGGVAGGVAGGTVGGTIGGEIGGQLGGTLGGKLGGTVGGGGNSVIPFGAGMNRPVKSSGPDPQYTREAREAKVEGTMLVKCVITTSGALTGCSILKGLPFMDQAVLSALAQSRYTPVMFNGQAVSVSYTIPIRLKLQ